MSTRREFIQSLPAVGTAFAVAGHLVLDESPARLKQPAPLKGHFHPKGKAPSKFTLDVLKQARPACRSPTRGTSRSRRRAYRSDEGSQDHGGRRPRRLGHGAVSVPGQAGRLRQHSSLAAPPVQAEQQLRALRGDPGHLSGPRLRPLRHHLRPRQDRLDRLRPAGDRGSRSARRGSCSRSTSARACRSRP